ncbi:hypothetical protein SDC9_172081 [bioreactor metagenome]|uniref:Uncharacterized protein n=1 Tax=bioreactor metagenome TaxID=1076179 RepID=A0A645GFX3_9ZZZZ
MKCAQDKVPCQSHPDSQMCRFLVSYFTDHQLVGVLPQYGTQCTSESDIYLLVYLDLSYPGYRIFNRIFNCDNVDLRFVDQFKE